MKGSTVQKITWAGFVISFVGSILFSTKAIIVKKAFADIRLDALTLLALRMLFALPFYIVIAIIVNSRKENNKKFTRIQWLQTIVIGLFGYYLSSLLDFEGLQYISAGLERLILFLYPSFAVLMNAFFFKQKVTSIQKWALLLTYAGIGIAYFGELKLDINNPNFVMGSVLIFLCAITYAFYIVGSGRIIPSVGASKFTAYAMLAACSGVLLHAALAGKSQALLSAQSNSWVYGLLLAVVATVIPTLMISNGMKRIGSNNVAIISSIGPVSTILQAHWVLGEQIFAAQIFGTVLVIAGVLLTGWKSAVKPE